MSGIAERVGLHEGRQQDCTEILFANFIHGAEFWNSEWTEFSPWIFALNFRLKFSPWIYALIHALNLIKNALKFTKHRLIYENALYYKKTVKTP